jgi:ABC-type multidrug transport system fused ATPase/permease subunit
MDSKTLMDVYQQRERDFSALLQGVKRKINLISNGRLLVAFIFLGLAYASFRQPSFVFSLPFAAFIFMYLVKVHSEFFLKKIRLENLVEINKREQEALQGNWSMFDAGLAFIDPHHPFSHDLDLFGDGSLYQYISRCNTLEGKKRLAIQLKTFLPDILTIQRHQDAIRELRDKLAFRQEFEAAGAAMGEQAHDRDQLREWLQQPSFLFPQPFYKYGLTIFPIITILFVAGTFIIPQLKPAAILCALIQWTFLGFHLKKVNLFHDYISRKKNILRKYATLLAVLKQEKFAVSHLAALTQDAAHANHKVDTLAKLVSAFDARLNSLTNFVLNSICMYDLQCVYRLEKWKSENQKDLNRWLDIISETEVLNSFANYAFNNSSYPYAEIGADLVIDAQGIGHPLIDASSRVANSIVLGRPQSVMIITGANMAGKSTFLRTLGVNIVLALNGAPVCATSFKCPLIFLRSGMRTADSLKDHASYFYAELARLKNIMEELRSDNPLLILLDEILKGTNSTDKLAGSVALVKQLLPHPCLALIATHDLALGDLETQFPEKIMNYCFEPSIENDQLFFDYQLKKGLAQKMNATFLMRKMGIIPA